MFFNQQTIIFFICLFNIVQQYQLIEKYNSLIINKNFISSENNSESDNETDAETDAESDNETDDNSASDNETNKQIIIKDKHEITTNIVDSIRSNVKSINQLVKILSKLNPTINVEEIVSANRTIISNMNWIIDELSIEFDNSDIEIESNIDSNNEVKQEIDNDEDDGEQIIVD